MESKNHKIERDFLEEKTKLEVIDYVNSINESIDLNDHHLKYLISKINGNSYMYDISKTELTNKITNYQSGGFVMKEDLPDIFIQLRDMISEKISISKDHSFLQIVDMNEDGNIERHYDASIEGFINYKCNISILSKDYDFCIDKETIKVKENDMYCFEASLFKHWTPNKFNSRRILLSFGFLIPYEDLGRSPEDPRVRLSKRIEKYFQK
jgi:hypothetical protein